MRLIDADVIKIPKGFFEKVDNVPKFYDWLDDQPTVEPVKHGRWKGKPIAGYSTVRCSVCGEVYTENNGRWLYCPNCGAKMDLEEGEEDE